MIISQEYILCISIIPPPFKIPQLNKVAANGTIVFCIIYTPVRSSYLGYIFLEPNKLSRWCKKRWSLKYAPIEGLGNRIQHATRRPAAQPRGGETGAGEGSRGLQELQEDQGLLPEGEHRQYRRSAQQCRGRGVSGTYLIPIV